MTEVHSCSYFCDRPECVKAQRDELRGRFGSMTDREIMQQALEALEYHVAPPSAPTWRTTAAITALRERLAQPEPEPIKESSVTHSHLWIGDLYGKEKNT